MDEGARLSPWPCNVSLRVVVVVQNDGCEL
jgi:hypothetical protein